MIMNNDSPLEHVRTVSIVGVDANVVPETQSIRI